MTKMQTMMYSIALALIFASAIIAEDAPLATIVMLIISGLYIRFIERG